MPADNLFKLVFFGSGAFGVPTLERLASAGRVVTIVTQPDRPAGRGGALTPTPVAQWAAAHGSGIPVLKPEQVNEPEILGQIRSARGAAFVVIAFGQKLGRSLLDGVFAINLHASLLPRWRGAAPINAAILAGDAETGNSVITLADRMDAGLVLGQSRRPIDRETTAGELHDLLSADGPALVEEVLERHGRGGALPAAQDESMVTIAPKLSKADGWVDFRARAEACRRRINGLAPWPGVTAKFRGEPLRLLRAGAGSSGSAHVPGSVLAGSEGIIACGEGTTVRLLEVQPAGKRAMPWQDFSNGRQVKSQEVLQGGNAPC